MIQKIIEKLLAAVIRKEKLVVLAFTFALGAACSALGLNKDQIKHEFCSTKDVEVALVQE